MITITNLILKSKLVIFILSFDLYHPILLGLNPTIKLFIEVALLIGPLSIFILISLLRKIEKDYPERIRWK